MNLNKLLTALRQHKNTPAHNLPAERHERYTHALEQFLEGHQPAVRLSGAYTLANLADEWLHRHLPPRAGTPRRSPSHRRRADRVHPHALPSRTEPAGPRVRRGSRRVRRRLYARSGGTTRRAAGAPHGLHGVQPPPRRNRREQQGRQRRKPVHNAVNIAHVG